jgi:hypothetical protein
MKLTARGASVEARQLIPVFDRRGSRTWKATMPRRLIVALTVACIACLATRSHVAEPSLLQEAAITFVAQSHSDKLACVRVASGPNEMEEGLVADHLVDPQSSVLGDLRLKGIVIHAYSACTEEERSILSYAIGWPRPTDSGFKVNVDRVCGPMCGNGFRVDVEKVPNGWRATGAAMTWVS